MDIDLRLPSGEQCKEDEDANGIDNMLDGDESLHNGMVQVVGEALRAEDGGEMHSSAVDMVTFKEDTNLEPLSGMEFESHGEAYSFYQEYARSMGFNTAIQNSRRSKTSREFIDAKFACSRYGTKREYDKSFNRPRARQSKQDPENATGRRSCLKTDCKASMHVKRRPDGKWVIHSFVKEHNHELLPAQAVSEQTRRMYAAMARQFAEYKNVVGLKNDPKNPFDKGRNLALEAADSTIPSQYILKRWTKEAKSRHFVGEESEQVQSRAQRYNDLFQRGMKLIEEGSLSQESYYIAFRSLEEAFGNCLSANTSNKSLAEAVASPTQEQEVMAVAPTDGLQQMDKLSSRSVALDSYFGAQPSVQGMVQLNLMAPRDNYYGNQQTIQGLGQLNTIATSHDGYYGTQQAMPGMGPMDFFRSPSFYIRDDPNVRVAQLHDDASRHT
ncbi:hypothetical protein GOBAR_DD35087 [Gossypium barbadense]|nr:hypothetical protein GOBAR_DD35087 [Gossypium barbadense]